MLCTLRTSFCGKIYEPTRVLKTRARCSHVADHKSNNSNLILMQVAGALDELHFRVSASRFVGVYYVYSTPTFTFLSHSHSHIKV